MIRKLLLGSSLGYFLLSSLLYLTVPPASADWLNGWDKRVKITINSTNINATLTNFPVLIHLSTNSGENAEDVSFVFDELGSNTNRKKIAVTTTDGTNQCYVEIEEWSHTNTQAWLWVKVPNVASNADTDLYIYYDNDQPDNTNYVGDPNSIPAENVWDSNFKLVTHMRDDPDISHIRDSTSNNNDGTKGASNQPLVTTNGKIDDAQNFDETYKIDIAHNAGLIPVTFTVEVWVNWDKLPSAHSNEPRIIEKATASPASGFGLTGIKASNKVAFYWADGTNWHPTGIQSLSAITASTWYHLVATYDGTIGEFFVDNVSQGASEFGFATSTSIFRIGTSIGWASLRGIDGIVEEVHFSNVIRSPAWIKASYETERDNLLDFGVEESRFRQGTVFSVR